MEEEDLLLPTPAIPPLGAFDPFDIILLKPLGPPKCILTFPLLPYLLLRPPDNASAVLLSIDIAKLLFGLFPYISKVGSIPNTYRYVQSKNKKASPEDNNTDPELAANLNQEVVYAMAKSMLTEKIMQKKQTRMNMR